MLQIKKHVFVKKKHMNKQMKIHLMIFFQNLNHL
jgi:hypothetical protein